MFFLAMRTPIAILDEGVSTGMNTDVVNLHGDGCPIVPWGTWPRGQASGAQIVFPETLAFGPWGFGISSLHSNCDGFSF